MEWNSLHPQLHLTKKEKQMEPVIPFASYTGKKPVLSVVKRLGNTRQMKFPVCKAIKY